jgi:hypothetical protein
VNAVLSGCAVRAAIQESAAEISPCGLYRYALSRRLNDNGNRRILWVMLNPSTADAETDDPTIRRCKQFSEDIGFNVMEVGNLYGFRSTDPKALVGMAEAASVGANNDSALSRMAFRADLILCAWGTKASHHRAVRVMSLLRTFKPLYALRITKGGHPAHPLYLPGSLRPIPLEGSQSDGGSEHG